VSSCVGEDHDGELIGELAIAEIGPRIRVAGKDQAVTERAECDRNCEIGARGIACIGDIIAAKQERGREARVRRGGRALGKPRGQPSSRRARVRPRHRVRVALESRMHPEFDFLLRHGYSVLFVLVLIDQLGAPLPATPVLIAAGAYAADGKLDLVRIVGLTVVASVSAHLFWYELARRSRNDILGLLCRVSLEPDYCARHAREFFIRWGTGTLVLASFMPGFIGVAAQPIAATVGMRRRTYLVLNLLGSFAWVAVCLGLGVIFSARIAGVTQIGARFGATGLELLGALFALYLGWKLIRRELLYRRLRMARISPEELKRRLDAAEPTFILDLRHALEFDAQPGMIPGALRMSPDDLEQRATEIPTDQEIVIYCTCPNEFASARAALQLKRRGIEKVRPLAGGLTAWRALGYSLVIEQTSESVDTH
jgi:membrane protein DedA with SNARE-associated domain/rhodanese-related sulfurtransferase